MAQALQSVLTSWLESETRWENRESKVRVAQFNQGAQWGCCGNGASEAASVSK